MEALIPEKRLLAAVLQRAVADFSGGEDDMSREAGSWLFGEDDNDEQSGRNDSDSEDPPLTL